MFISFIKPGIIVILTISLWNFIFGYKLKRLIDKEERCITSFYLLNRFQILFLKTFLIFILANIGLIIIYRIILKLNLEPPSLLEYYVNPLMIDMPLYILILLIESIVCEDILHRIYLTKDAIDGIKFNYLVRTFLFVLFLSLIILVPYDLILKFNPKLHEEIFAIHIPVDWRLYIIYIVSILFFIYSSTKLFDFLRLAILTISQKNLKIIKDYFMEKGVISSSSLSIEDSKLGLIFNVTDDKIISKLGEILNVDDYKVIKERSLFSSHSKNKVGFSPKIIIKYLKSSCEENGNLICYIEKLFELIEENYISDVMTLKIIMSAVLFSEIITEGKIREYDFTKAI